MMNIENPNLLHPTVHVPPFNDPTDDLLLYHSPCHSHPFDALRRYLPSNDLNSEEDSAYACDEFRMYEFKVRRCPQGRSHDWTECPYAHPGEKARRRDPRKFHYSGVACSEFRKGMCRRGESCEYAHGVFECWLHPARYRTQPCKDGTGCVRRVCFFAHTAQQLRVLTPHHSPRYGLGFDSYFSLSSPTSTLMSPCFSTSSDSPPLSPNCSINNMMLSMRNLDLGSVKPVAWTVEHFEEEPVMERVESGRNLRAKIFEKLSKENSFKLGSDLVM